MAKSKRKEVGAASSPTPKGRPSKYTPQIGDIIAAMLADGILLVDICQLPDMPSERTVRTWALDAQHPFSPLYTRARELGYQVMADQLLKIADSADGDAQRDRLRVETRKWILSKALPKMYGDKVAVTDADGGNLVVKFVS